MRESQDERRPNPTKGTRPPPPTDREGFREGNGCDLDGLERGAGGQGGLEIDGEGFCGERRGEWGEGNYWE